MSRVGPVVPPALEDKVQKSLMIGNNLLYLQRY